MSVAALAGALFIGVACEDEGDGDDNGVLDEVPTDAAPNDTGDDGGDDNGLETVVPGLDDGDGGDDGGDDS